MTWRQRALLLLPVLALAAAPQGIANAAGPRWVAGSTWTNEGKPMGWYRNAVQYFVDPGPLSAQVDHAAAAALVDAAAAVWKSDGVDFTLTDGGVLAEDVSGSNVYPGANGPVWPQDAASENYSAKQIAVIFDADGAITDMLLGSGASAPANCRQSAVTESVDRFIQPGKIAHALILINGRCSGGAPEQQLQLRYQLMRTFGRVIGLGWSQTNDNVFTGSPAPTYLQQMHWPIMHPIDILCGQYTYQCLPEPFRLRDDDIASLAMVYAPNMNSAVPGGIITTGWITFPNGMGMNGVHVAARRQYPWDAYGTEPFEDVSAVSGFLAVTDFGNPVTGAAMDPNSTGGTMANWAVGYFVLYDIPALPQYNFQNIIVNTAAINPLYVGAYAVGPYRTSSPVPSGSSLNFDAGAASGGYYIGAGSRSIDDASSVCNGRADGTENAPEPLPASGFWSGRFCGASHPVWNSFPVRAGRTATVEVTALDETGAATTSKAVPLIGLWNGSDSTGGQPSLARSSAAFNAPVLGSTQLRWTSTGDEPVRLVLTDARGDGRPDYIFRARLLYADTVLPARLPPAGGEIRILGTGFQPGCVVTVGGVLATIRSLSATEIDATAPALADLGGNTVNTVAVADRSTRAYASIDGGLTYSGGAGDTIAWTSQPPASVAVNAPVAVRLAVTDSEGHAARNAVVTLSATGGSPVWDICGLATCTVVSDASGAVAARMTPGADGTVTLTASLQNGTTVQASTTAVTALHSVTFLRPVQYVAAGGAAFHPSATLAGSGQAQLAWAASARIALGSMQSSGAMNSIVANAALRDNETASVQLCAWTNVCATEAVVGVAAADLNIATLGGDAQSVSSADSLAGISARVVDAGGHGVAGAQVGVYQQAFGWQPVCNLSRCPAPPVYGASSDHAVTNDDGEVTIAPLQHANVAEVVKITLTTGTSGAQTFTLQKTP